MDIAFLKRVNLMTYNEYLQYIRDKNVGFLGIGRSNMPLIRILCAHGVRVTARDRKAKDKIGDFYKELLELNVTVKCGEGYLDGLSEHDILYKTPAIRPDLPEILKAEETGTLLTSEMELFFELCPCDIYAVTGSDGKTTTTTLIYEMLKKQGYTCHLGGNIGRPLIGDIDKIKKDDAAVIELSSFQLFNMKKSPKTAVITNISENHLDWHRDFQEYIDAKKNIFKYQDKGSLLVLNEDNAYTRAMKNEAKGKTYMFSLLSETDGVYLKDGVIYHSGEEIMKQSDIILPGIHNVANYMAAMCAVMGKVSYENMRAVAKTFGGVEHRIEFVREHEGVSYYNDSIGSSPARTTATLNSFPDKVILIAGGYDKQLSYEELGRVIAERVKYMVLLGATSDKIEKGTRACSDIPIVRASDLKSAVLSAKAAAKKGDKVVLSPASASFDMFRDFEERGRTFKDIVNSL